jgi:hypothetical protein
LSTSWPIISTIGPDVLGGLGLQARAQGQQGVGVLVIGRQVAVGDHLDRDALGRGLGVDLVVHVGDVAGIDHRVLAIDVAQQAEQHVEHHHRPEVADVGVVVDRRPADIHRHPARIGGNEVALFARHGVVKLDGHGKGRPDVAGVLRGCGLAPYNESTRARPRFSIGSMCATGGTRNSRTKGVLAQLSPWKDLPRTWTP